MAKNRLYIAYGSNLNLSQMGYRCPNAKIAGKGMVKGYELLFRGVATIEPKEGGNVPVLLWKLSQRDELALDHYEGWPRLYRKEMVDVEMKGKSVSAMVYVMNEGREAMLPSDYYYNVIAQGYGTAGFDLAVLEQALERTKEVMAAEHVQKQELPWSQEMSGGFQL